MHNKTPLHIGYKRVSSNDQCSARQLDGVSVSLVFEDQLSGKNSDRPELQKLIQDETLHQLHDVTLHVHSLDRLARNLIDLQSLIDTFTQKGYSVVFHKENWIFKAGSIDSMQKLMLQMFGAFAEFERALIRERQREGIAIAKLKGVYKGRAPSLNKMQIEDLNKRAQTGASKESLAKAFGISRSSVYSYMKAA